MTEKNESEAESESESIPEDMQDTIEGQKQAIEAFKDEIESENSDENESNEAK